MTEGRYQPLLSHVAARHFIGAITLVGSTFLAARNSQVSSVDIWQVAGMLVLVWLPATLLTDRYRHKYPQRYFSYLLASHLKGAVIMGVLAFGVWWLQLPDPTTRDLLWPSIVTFLVVDLALSVPRRRADPRSRGTVEAKSGSDAAASAGEVPAPAPVLVSADDVRGSVLSGTSSAVSELIRTHVPISTVGTHPVSLIHDLDESAPDHVTDGVGLLVGALSLNHVDRLNNYLRYVSGRVAMGGYLVLHYTPMESTLTELRRRYRGVRYSLAYAAQFLRYRALPKIPVVDRLYFHPAFAWFDRGLRRLGFARNRALTKAEVWGRLAYYGCEVLHESETGPVRHIVAQRVSEPVGNRKPSFYAVVALEKVGLDGTTIRLHKVRSMYPFSEFLQKKVFQSHGLSNTGKFRDDFRLTDYGPLIRKSWIDEIPGLFDWLRGDLKLVGMRATSPHYLGLYPQEIYDMYIRVKPGLVPPIFDEKTAGFDEIVEIERQYLSRYLQAPVRTDIQYLWFTLRDIFIRKVRSS